MGRTARGNDGRGHALLLLLPEELAFLRYLKQAKVSQSKEAFVFWYNFYEVLDGSLLHPENYTKIMNKIGKLILTAGQGDDDRKQITKIDCT